MLEQFRSLYRQKYLLWGFVRADLRNRYGASFLGLFWSVINPLLLILLYVLVFGYILDVNVGGNAGPKNYGIFLFAGMLPWIGLSDAVQRSSMVIMENKDFVKQVNFPKIMLPLRCVLGAFLHEIVALIVFIVILAALGQSPSIVMFGLLFAIWPLQLLFTLGIAMIVSAVTVFYKDARELTAAILTLWFFGTPIIFPVVLVPESIKAFFYLNPLTWLVNLYRAALLGDVVPDLYGFSYFSALSLLVAIIGWVFFHRFSRDFADLI
ncbi:ABC transporter permease [bacterium]|nr:ABC transporter permease [bacterium]